MSNRQDQSSLVEARTGAVRLEVHTHSYVTGEIVNGKRVRPFGVSKITHSHEGGDVPHKHEGMGPATYTIDKDAWRRATGLVGGGRKKFTAKPNGPQFARVELEDWQKSFRIIVGEQPANCPACGEQHGAVGGGHLTAVRMVQQFGMTVEL